MDDTCTKCGSDKVVEIRDVWLVVLVTKACQECGKVLRYWEV